MASRTTQASTPTADEPATLLTPDDVYLFNEGTHYRLFERLGAHPATFGGRHGVAFAVWAPNADYVSVVGDFNGWDRGANPMRTHAQSGIWEAFIEGLEPGTVYKYHVSSGAHRGYAAEKADPFGFRHEVPPRTASVVHPLDYAWRDEAWMRSRPERVGRRHPMSVYEMHVGSWMHAPEDGGSRPLTYRELAPRLAEYLVARGFTHVELLPVMEHPLYRSWGYQTTGYFAPTSRFGTAQDLMFLVDTLHQAGVGVILDWVPSHFPSDEHGLGYFDGTHLFEHADPRQGFHPDWKSLIFNYGRNEVRAFLISSAVFWLEKFHADGLRVDAVASMLYLDYSRAEGEWIPNEHGGNENLGALRFLKRLNEVVYERFPDVQTVAEESTAWPMVSRPTSMGGLGFGLKWDMGWMHDTLQYLANEPIHRRWHHDDLTFRMVYAFTESYVLPLSHDEVVHGKGSLLGKMPGDRWQRFANLRALYGWMYGMPGKKLLFMGAELAQDTEWDHDSALPWHLLDQPDHEGVRRWLADLNDLHRREPALHERDCEPAGFEWVDAADVDASVLSFLRWPARDEHGRPLAEDGRPVLVVANMTPVPRDDYRIGVPQGGRWEELANGDATDYGGSGVGNLGGVVAEERPEHGRPWSVALTLPPLSIVFLAPAAG